MPPDPVFENFWLVLSLGNANRQDVERAIETLVGVFDVGVFDVGVFDEGPMLVDLTENRFVLVPTVYRRLSVGCGTEELISELWTVDKTIRAALVTADAVWLEYRSRRLRPEFAPSASAGDAGAPIDAQRSRSTIGGARAWRGIRFAHLGTGYTAHQALGFAPSSARSFVMAEDGLNFLEPNELPLENVDRSGSPGHGTRTLSIICGEDVKGFSSVAPGATAVPYRVTECEVIDTSSPSTPLPRALRHAVFDTGCEVICIPLFDPNPPVAAVAEQIDAAYEAGAIIVAPAGDLAPETAWPGRYQRVITVAGLTAIGRPWLGSGRGLAVDVCGPATEILCADTRAIPGHEQPEYVYTRDSGTGYACAFIAGAAILWLARHRSSLAPYGSSWRLVEAFRACLGASAQKPDWWNPRLWGEGVLDLPRLLSWPLPDPSALVMRGAASLQKW
jgi:hypothetical protein